MSISEKPVVDAELLAIEEINENGGVLGHKVISVLKDGKSDVKQFARFAEELTMDESIKVQ